MLGCCECSLAASLHIACLKQLVMPLRVRHVVCFLLFLPLLQLDSPNCQARARLVKELENDMRAQHGMPEPQQIMLSQQEM
jgi:hypothetical protein